MAKKTARKRGSPVRKFAGGAVARPVSVNMATVSFRIEKHKPTTLLRRLRTATGWAHIDSIIGALTYALKLPASERAWRAVAAYCLKEKKMGQLSTWNHS